MSVRSLRLQIGLVLCMAWGAIGAIDLTGRLHQEISAVSPRPGSPVPQPATPRAVLAAARPATSSSARRDDPPGAAASLEQIRGFLEAHPDYAKARQLRTLHDRKLLPCPGHVVACNPELTVLVEGVVDRAERYLSQCLDCRDSIAVKALEQRLAATVRRTKSDLYSEYFDAAFERGDYDAAAQSLAEAAGVAPRSWIERAKKRLLAREPSMADTLDSCGVSAPFAALVSPALRRPGRPVRVLFVGNEPMKADVTLELESIGSNQPLAASRTARGGGPPWFFMAELAAPSDGHYRAVLRDGATRLACQRFFVSRKKRSLPRPDTVWQSVRGWDEASENLYSAFVELLFSAREGQRWQGLHGVTRDPARNVLFNHLGLGEDDPTGLEMQPDCADAPYTIRAYFAWKLGLPFGRHRCGFGTLNGPPRCGDWATNDGPARDLTFANNTVSTPPTPAEPRLDRVHEFEKFVFDLKNDVYARSLRTELSDETTDVYPVALSRESLRPGSVFTDPYGHTLTLVHWQPQTSDQEGVLLAVDAQPDGSLRIKRFWRGNFLFPSEHAIGGYGFKAFRPIVLDDGEPRLLTNDEISAARGFSAFSLEQSRLDAAGFYANMASLINPRPITAERELRLLVDALHAQLELRVTEVAAAEEILAERPGKVVAMPSGREMFHTNGDWEALSTPCRDLRLLVGIDTLLGFPAEAALRVGQPIAAELERLLRTWTRESFVAYRKSDGSIQTLNVAELIARQNAFEMAYNPNDCPELRWGAPEGSAELASCQRRAPVAQRKLMESQRHWFKNRYACG